MFDAQNFIEALNELETTNGISKSSIIEALKESLKKAYTKSLGGGDDADVRVIIEENPPKLELLHVKKVVKEVEDDYLEISEEDAQEIDKKLKAGDEFITKVNVNELSRLTALTVKSILRQKITEAEKGVLYETFKDKTGEMITGTVEKSDDRGTLVNIGRTSLFLSKKELIGEEIFNAGDQIRLYVSEVKNSEKGAQIKVSRSEPGFLKCIFEECVREVYDGTVVIKNIVREAGIRSKVAVYSNDPNVDCVAACIGLNGNSIKAIFAELGNSRDKEKVDIIPYSPNDGLYIVDALRPATVLGIYLEKETGPDGKIVKQATAVVPDGQLSLAIGRRGANARLACKLTGWNIDVIEQNDLVNFDYKFSSVEELQKEEQERLAKEKYEKYLQVLKEKRAKEASMVSENTTANEKVSPKTINDDVFDTPEEEVIEVVETKPVEKVIVETKPEVEKPKTVKTTTTLESLERSLETKKKEEEFKGTKKTSKRPRKITEDEIENVSKKPETKSVVPQMDIYSKEELEEMENEELYAEEYEDEDIDYEDYDQYYEEDK